MTLAQKRELTGKAETQAIYGTRVGVVDRRGAWLKVVLPSQPSNLDARGYPGWVPSRQLTGTAPVRTSQTAIVRTGTTWLWSDSTVNGPAGSRLMEISYDTRLPVIRSTPAYVVVSLLGGRHAAVNPHAVAIRSTGTSAAASRNAVVDEAKGFLGLPYLWGGTSGFGFDCSGLTYAVYAAFGRTLSRDASQQARNGTPIQGSSLLPGDLVFFRDSASGPVAHVGLYVGNGSMIDAPHTGAVVRIDQVSSFPYYAGARRLLAG
jgi:cell wall-associated NlpC family hydrolase